MQSQNNDLSIKEIGKVFLFGGLFFIVPALLSEATRRIWNHFVHGWDIHFIEWYILWFFLSLLFVSWRAECSNER